MPDEQSIMNLFNNGFILLDKNKNIICENYELNNILQNDFEWQSVIDSFKFNIDNRQEIDKIICISEDKDKYVNIKYRIIMDENNDYLGSYFLLQSAHMKNNSEIHSLTGLYNKVKFCDEATKWILMNKDNKYILIVLDIDQFKIINEIFGRVTGNNIICRISKNIKEYAGRNKSNSCLFAHLNDDRFVLLMPENEFNENEFFDSMHNELSIDHDSKYKIVMHAGICEVDMDEKPLILSLIDKATLALTDIKGNMQIRTARYKPHIMKKIITQQNIINEIDAAISDKNICFYIQPQTDAHGNSFGGEALVRWIDPKKGVLTPNEFIPTLEDKNLISKMDLYIWNLVCQKLRDWKDKGWNDYYLSVNISAQDLCYMDIYDEFTTLVEKYEIDASMLKLEITESAAITDKAYHLEKFKKLRDFGFTIEIDDFGSGYSSLNMLKDMTFDILKIDMVFLETTINEEKSQNIIKTIIQLAKCIDADVIMEGVETKEQVEFLNEAGCNIFQGYYFDKPLPVEEFERKYIKSSPS